MSRSTSFSTAAVLLSARAQTVIGPPGDLCSGDGTFNNLSTTCSCPQVKPQQRKCPGYCRKQLSAPVDLLHVLTILHQMPGRRKCFQRSRYTLSAPLPQTPTGMHHLVCYHPHFHYFHRTATSLWPRFWGWSLWIGEPHRFDVLVSCLNLWLLRRKRESRVLGRVCQK